MSSDKSLCNVQKYLNMICSTRSFCSTHNFVVLINRWKYFYNAFCIGYLGMFKFSFGNIWQILTDIWWWIRSSIENQVPMIAFLALEIYLIVVQRQYSIQQIMCIMVYLFLDILDPLFQQAIDHIPYFEASCLQQI